MVTRFAPRSARRWGWSPAIRRRESPTACIRLAMEPLEARHLLAVGGFTAFNEHVAGAGTHTNTTLYGADPASDSSGPLKDIDTGQNTSVVLSTAQVGVVFGSQGAAPAGGTDAGNLFNGFVDFAGPAPHSLEIEQGDSYTHTLTGLNPNKSYEFAGTAVRGNNAYTNRWTLVTLSGADSFVSAHSTGIGVVTAALASNQVALWFGANHNPGQGFIAQWTDIDPGSDGIIQVVSTQYRGPTPGVGTGNSSTGSKGYGLAGIRLVEHDLGFRVTAGTPADGEGLVTPPASATIDFTLPVIASSVQPGDLTLDGAGAAGATIVDADTVRFEFASTPTAGAHTLRIGEGVILGGDVADSRPIETFTSTFTVLASPTTATFPSSRIEARSAVVGANVLSTGGEDPDVLVYYGDEDGGTNAAAWDGVLVLGQVGIGIIEGEVFNLNPATTYYYRAFASNRAGGAWAGQTLSLQTTTIGPAAIVTNPATAVGAFAATLAGEVTDTGGDPPTVTVFYGREDGGVEEDVWQHAVVLTGQSGTFAREVTNLDPQTTYFVRAQAENGAGIVWSPATRSFVTSAAPALQITEFMADNAGTLTTRIRPSVGEPFGAVMSPDWIEIHNPAQATVNLSGFHLTDDAGDPTAWQFPTGTTIAGGGYLVVYASGEDVTNPVLDEDGRLHTDFSLNKGGEYLSLADPLGVVVFEYAPEFPPQTEDVAYGISSDGVERFFPSPTPGGENTSLADLAPPPPEFSRPSSTFSGSTSVQLSTDEPGGVIRYTTNGATPTAASTLYSGAISIGTTAAVRAIVIGSNGLASPIASQTYVELASNVLDDSSDLPMIVIDTFGGSIGTSSRRLNFFALFEPSGGTTMLTGDIALGTRAGIEIRGSSSVGFPKKNYRLEFWDEQNEDRDLAPLGMPADADWILYGPGTYDRALINNPFSYALSNQVGRYAVRTRWVEVYINTGGGTVSSADYVGLYALVEEVKRGDDRVDVERLTTTAPIEGGFIRKIDRGSPYVYPREAEINSAQRSYVDGYINSFQSALNSGNFTDPNVGYARWIDVDSFIDHNLINMLTMNVDALRLSTYMFKTADGKLEMGPVWDFDRALDSTDGRDNNPQSWNGTGDGTNYFTYGWWDRLFDDPNFWQHYIDRWQELREDEFSLANINGLIDSMAEEIRQAQARDYARWDAPRFGGFQGEINHVKDWLASRIAWVDSRFVTRPQLSHPGGEISPGFLLSLSAPQGTILYSLDGTDPRLPGGGISPAAISYGGPITLSENTIVRARALESPSSRDGAFNNRAWSGLAERFFVTDEPEVRITEIMFNPPDANLAADELDVDSDQFEFIELMNVGDETIDLGDLQFTGGVELDFAAGGVATLLPGERVVVVNNLPAFVSRYGPGINVAGEFSGDTQLANDGERIELRTRFQQIIHDFSYGDSWHPSADGGGFSLVILDPHGPLDAWDQAAGWRASGAFGGSPGADDSGIPAGAVVINELLTHSDADPGDWIELYNTTAEPQDIGGWFLSDDPDELTKFQIPPNTMINPGQYLVFNQQDHFGNPAHPGSNIAFALSELGESVHLTSLEPATGDPGGYRESVTFAGTDNGVTLARYVNTAGFVDLVAASLPTFAAANAPPAIPGVVINEIMVDPAAGEAEFVELHNRAAAAAPLYDVANPNNTWRLTNGVQFTFPTGVSIPAGGYLLVVPIPPDDFRSLYNVPPGVPILGPYTGSLENQGEKLEVSRPGKPELDGTVPYVVNELVRYNDKPPWPALPDGSGASLARVDAAAWGNEPAHWAAGTSGGTPGEANRFVDSSPPTVPANLSATVVGDAQLRLDWTAARDNQSGVGEYRIYRGSVRIGTSSTTSFTDTGASLVGPVSYRVSAVNGDGFEGPLSVALDTSVVAMQDGVSPTSGYAGTRDTELNQGSPNVNFETDTTLRIDGDTGNGLDEWTLVKFDLSSISPGTSVLGGALTLRVSNASAGPYYLYQMLRDWREDQATWNQFAGGQPWQAAGAQGAGDRGSTILGTINPVGTGTQDIALNPDGVALVQAWIDGAVANHGFMLFSSSNNDSFQFDSSETGIVANRPRLSVAVVASDNTSPRVTSATLAAASPHEVVIEFEEDVQLTVASLRLHNDTTGTDVNPGDLVLNYNAAARRATFTFPSLAGGNLPAGDYTATLGALTTADTAGNPLDGNGDGAGGDDYTFNFNVQGSSAAVIRGRHVFYNNSVWDGYDPAAGAADDGAIAVDKSPLLPGDTATPVNYTSYVAGVNGIILDVENLADPSGVGAAAFQFRAGNTADPATWPLAALPGSVTVRPGAGVDNSDRVTLTWPDAALTNQWLQVTVAAGGAIGLADADVFYFGNAVGDAGVGNLANVVLVDARDRAAVRNNAANHLNPAAVDNAHDFNRDGLVDARDRAIPLAHPAGPLAGLRLLTVPGGPLPAVDGSDEALAAVAVPAQQDSVSTTRHARDAAFAQHARRRVIHHRRMLATRSRFPSVDGASWATNRLDRLQAVTVDAALKALSDFSN